MSFWRQLTRGLRGFADGLVSVLLAGYLTRLGFTPFQVGAVVTGTLLGSAALTIALGLAGHRLDRRPVLEDGLAARGWDVTFVAAHGTEHLAPEAVEVDLVAQPRRL